MKQQKYISPRKTSFCSRFQNLATAVTPGKSEINLDQLVPPVNSKFKENFDQYLNTNFETHQSKRQKQTSTQMECQNLAKSILDSGQKIYINVTASKDTDIIRATTSFKKKKCLQEDGPYNFYGAYQTELTAKEKNIITYLNEEANFSEKKQKLGLELKHKYLKNIDATVKREILRRKQTLNYGMNQGNIDLPYLVEGSKQLKSPQYKLLKIKRQGGIVTTQRLKIGQRFLKVNKSQTRSNSVNSRIENLQKYDMTFSQYQRKKTNKRISQEYEDSVKSKYENVIRQFQQYIINEIQISQKNKQNILRGFARINKETSKY